LSDRAAASKSHKTVLTAIGVVLAGYVLAAAFGLPQRGTGLIVAGGDHQPAARDAVPGAQAVPAPAGARHHPPYWMALPFVALLAAIAALPLAPTTAHWWESNLHRFYVAGGLAAITLLYYLLLHPYPIAAHWPTTHTVPPSAAGPNFVQAGEVLANATLSEFVPFIVLLFSLYTISGGIRIEGDLPAHPLTNCGFLAVGAVLASFIGTTGAAMLLIRPLLETNESETRSAHGRLLHFHRLQLWRLSVAAGRSAAVLGLPDGRPIPLDGGAVEGVAVCQCGVAGDLLFVGPLWVLAARAAR